MDERAADNHCRPEDRRTPVARHVLVALGLILAYSILPELIIHLLGSK